MSETIPKPCPFCGSEPCQSMKGDCRNDAGHPLVWYLCKECGAGPSIGEWSWSAALARWNTRSRSVREEELEKAVAQVRAATSDVEFEHRCLKLVEAALAMFPKEEK